MADDFIPYGRPVVTSPLKRVGDTWSLDFSVSWSGSICLAGKNSIGWSDCSRYFMKVNEADDLVIASDQIIAFGAAGDDVDTDPTFYIQSTGATVNRQIFVVGNSSLAENVEIDMQSTAGTFYFHLNNASGYWACVFGSEFIVYDPNSEVLTLQPGGGPFVQLTSAGDLQWEGAAADPGTPGVYSAWANTTSLNLKGKRPSFASNFSWPSTIGIATASSTAIANTAVKSYFDNTDDWTVLANTCAVGTCFELEAWGIYSTKAATPGNLTLGAEWGTTTVVSTVVGVAAAQTNAAWHLRAVFIVRSTGGSGTINAVLQGSVRGDAISVTNATTTVATNANAKPEWSATWATADTSNTITCLGCTLKQIW